MITKINKIKDFGIFRDFKWNSLPELKKFNLIYGWNYSGKTTLSRVFRCFEKSCLHEDYKQAIFELENNNVKYDNTFTQKPNIRVFNSDFIKENLKWDSENIEPIFLLGEENINLQTELKTKETELATAETTLATLKLQQKDKQTRIDNTLTNKARDITNLLSLGRNFNRQDLKQLVEEDNVSVNILNPADFDRYKTQALSTEQKPNLNTINITIPNIQNFKNKVEEILQRQTASSNKVQKWLDNTELSSWVEKGKQLHVGKTVCEFCGNILPSDLFIKLNEHFSKDYDKLKSDIEQLLRELNASKITVNFPADTAFYSDVLPNIQIFKLPLETEINNFNAVIDVFLKDMANKKEKPFDKLIISDFVDNTTQLQTAVAKLNDVIIANNKRTTDFTDEKNNAIKKLKLHFAAEFETTEHYSIIKAELNNGQTNINTNTTLIDKQKKEIIEIKAQLEETVKGAEKVNEYLKIFFGKDDIQIESTDDKKFKLVRGAEIAKNLSEGEKTAIAFAYFTAKLDEQNNQLTDTIVYIDDPVSSLDSNHLFNIYSFIKNTFYELKKDQNGGKIHLCKCVQLFISTHNFEFYNLIYDWIKVKSIGKDKQTFLTIERIKNSQKDESIIKESDNLIQKYKSEYIYLFSLLYEFQQNPSNDFKYLYHLPNIARKFVETYLNFKYLSAINIEESINSLITNSINCERVRKFMHYYSHDLTTNSFMKFPDFSECKDIIGIIIEAIRINDETHYNSLIGTVT